jgi:hypothetical protein
VTVPVAADDETVAVKVTLSAVVGVAFDAVSVVVVVSAGAAVTVTVTTLEVLVP